MASLKMTGLDDIEKMFRILSDPTQMAIEAINEAAPVLEKHLKSEIMSAAEHPTGGLAGSIHTMAARKNEYGVFSVVKPEGTDEKGIEYTERMRWLDVGVHDRSGQWHRGKGVRQKAVNNAKAECRKILENNVERFAEKAMR